MPRRRAAGAQAQRDVDVVARLCGAGFLQLLGNLLEVLDLETDVMDAAPALAALGARDDVVLEAQDGEIDVAVGEEITGGALAVELSHHLQSEVLHVEPLGCLFVLGLNRDMSDACHGRLPSWFAPSPIVAPATPAACPRKTRSGSRVSSASPRRALRASGPSSAG